MAENNSNKPFQMPGSGKYMRPGIDDRPDLDDAFDDNQMQAINRLAMPMTTERIEEQHSIEDADLQVARMSAESGAAAVAAVATEVPGTASAFLDMRDPMVSADGHRPTMAEIWRLAIGFTLGAILGAIPWLAMNSVLLPELLLKIDPAAKDAMVATISSAGAIVALFANLIFGTFSDLTRSRFGRRTPWIVSGGIVAGAAVMLIATASNAWVVVVLMCIAQLGYNMMLAPFVATMSDRVPDKFRGTVSAFYGAGITAGQTLGTLIGSRITNTVQGFIISGVIFAVLGIIIVFLWPREKSSKNMPREDFSIAMILNSFRPPHNAPDFYLALVGRTLMMSGYFMISSYQLYIVQFYIFRNDAHAGQNAKTVIAIMSTITLVVSMIAAFVSGPVADFIGKRKLPVALASVLFAIGAAMPWIFHNATGMYLFAAVAGFGYGVYNAIDQALNVAILPNPEEAGKDLGILNLANTICTVLGSVLTAGIFMLFHSYALVFPVCIVVVLAAAFIIMQIKSVD
ncbi:MFS transporter [Alloscardovia venturai]|uniref:MFS transporter n=1 Tax=Alloscardovia venturai TaxID=1769421 RepID=A0ABW2Y348_9BIFI